MVVEGCLICLTVLAFIFVVSYVYFAITGRCRAIEAEAKEDERYLNQANWDDQIKVLTVRIGEITSENQRLNGVVREWMNIANTYKVENDKLNKSLEEWQKQSEDYKNQVKEKEITYMDLKKEFDKLQTKNGETN